MSTASVKQALTDRQAVALTIWGEARGESLEGRVAVGMIIKNRVRSKKRWSSDWRKVCHQRWQFSCWQRSGGVSNHERVMAWARYFESSASSPFDPQEPPSSQMPDVDDYQSIKECLYVADGVMQDWLVDKTRRADHYYSPSAMIPPGTEPSWAKNKAPVAIIGRHHYYRLAV